MVPNTTRHNCLSRELRRIYSEANVSSIFVCHVGWGTRQALSSVGSASAKPIKLVEAEKERLSEIVMI